MTVPAALRWPSIGPDSWTEFIQARLSQQWRQVEWDSARWSFVGDPANPQTKAFHCGVTRCTTLAASKNSLCLPCRHAFGRQKATLAIFQVEHRPHASRHAWWGRFDLAGRSELLRSEMLYGLQQRDLDGVILCPNRVRSLLSHLPTEAAGLLTLPREVVDRLGAADVGLLRALLAPLRRLDMLFRRADATEPDVWDCALVGLRADPNRPYVSVTGTVDFTVVVQPWLRELVKQYGRDVRPSVSQLRRTVQVTGVASRALRDRPNGNVPGCLGMADMTAVFEAVSRSVDAGGADLSVSHRQALWSYWRRMIDYCRQADLMTGIPGSFAVNAKFHAVPSAQVDDEEAIRAIPEDVIGQLDAHLHLLGGHSTFQNGAWCAADFNDMYRTIYQLLRDTGRRPGEIAALKRNCLEYTDEKPVLVYDNHKRRRFGRRLPISTSTAEVIINWHRRLEQLPNMQGGEQWMFPQPGGRNQRRRTHVTASHFGARVLPAWLAAMPDLTRPGLTPQGQAALFAKSLITPYGFRHAYAQRHADAGTPVDVLRELMDHRAVDTTMGYYQVSLHRKRQAIATLSKFTLDRHGNPVGSTDGISYERESVAVPFGGCTEPSNIKAGGGHCPIRFQCAGCNFYRPDPSYLPAIDHHVAALRGDKEMALASDAATWVTDNLDAQIGAFTGVADTMRHRLAALPEQERNTIEDAARQLRKARQAAAFIPVDQLTARHAR